MCIVTRTVKDEAELVRFVRGPDGVVVPDLARKLPGRGVWVSLDRRLLDQAIALNPNMALGWRSRAYASLFAGQHEMAIQQAGRAHRLNPLDPGTGIALLMASALLLLGRHDEALVWAKQSVRENPNAVMSLRALASAHAFLGDLEEARRIGQEILELDPTLTLSRARAFSAFRRPEDLSKWIEGIRLAGVPE